MSEKVAINGRIMEPHEAKVSVFDRGFLYGDAVYEVTRSYGKILFQLEAHLDRLQRSADCIGMSLGVTRDQLVDEIYRVVGATGQENQYMRIQVSRGEGPISLSPDASSSTTRVIYVKPLQAFPATHYTQGVPVAVSTLWRNSRHAMDPNIKSGNYLNNILALRETLAQKPHETLLLNSQGQITEGTTANIFFVKGGAIVTPPDDFDILWGITRTLVLRLASRLGIPVQLRGFRPDELWDADEVFLTSSTREVMPVSSVNGKPIKTSPGEITRRLTNEFKGLIREYCEEARGRHPWDQRSHG